jgi:hypothetical protein
MQEALNATRAALDASARSVLQAGAAAAAAHRLPAQVDKPHPG